MTHGSKHHRTDSKSQGRGVGIWGCNGNLIPILNIIKQSLRNHGLVGLYTYLGPFTGCFILGGWNKNLR
jgi:hypothetical protein